jgi:cytoplasmic iron level regulating protein YaaA (DUF328/UPF0246 family)
MSSKKQINTLDEKHSEMMANYHVNETETLPKLELEIESLKQKVRSLKPSQIDEFMDIKDTIRKKRQEIKIIK